MKMVKVFIAMLLSLGLLSSVACAASWPAWAADARRWAEEREISNSFLQTPEAALSRAQVVQLLYEAAGKPAVSSEEFPFEDVQDSDAAAVAWAVEQGIVQGTGDGCFLPESPVSRQEFAVMLYRLAGEPAVRDEGWTACEDAAKAASWAHDALVWSTKTGVMQGKAGNFLAPLAQVTVPEAMLMLQRCDWLPDAQQLLQDLQTLTEVPRPIGSEGEAEAADYLYKRFSEMGYQVSTQVYTNDSGASGTNVIAVKPADTEQADILVISAHHDSVPTAYGANDNASGVAALLAVAELVQALPTDTEVRFVSFTDEENGKNGSRYYVDSLPQAERERIIGDLQLDMLGGLGSTGTLLATTDGASNWLTELLQGKNASYQLIAETASDHASFQLAGVPSVLVMQNERGYLYHSAADTAEEIDLAALSGAVQSTVAALLEIMSADTASYRTVAQAQGDGYTYRQTRQNVIYFSSSIAETEAYIGAAGELVDTYEVSGDGWTDTYESYYYSMRWFDGETPMNTYYQYRNGFLSSIEIRPAETGYTLEQVRSLIEEMYGAPVVDENGETGWADTVYSKYITLSYEASGNYTVTVSSYSAGVSNVLATYTVTNGETEISDPEDKAVWDYVCSILPLECRQKITQFHLFTDGYSNILAYTAPVQENGVSDNTQFSLNIDYYDVYDENGVPRDWSKLTYTILHEYGHVLLEDETQVDLTKGETTHDPAGFVEGSFRKAFYDRFWKDLGDSAVQDYEENPTHYVSRYGANYFHEDIADTFAVFVLGGKPEGKTVAEEKLLFFWADDDMVQLRSEIRENLNLA